MDVIDGLCLGGSLRLVAGIVSFVCWKLAQDARVWMPLTIMTGHRRMTVPWAKDVGSDVLYCAVLGEEFQRHEHQQQVMARG